MGLENSQLFGGVFNPSPLILRKFFLRLTLFASLIIFELLTLVKTHHPHCCIRQYLPLVMVPPALNSWYRVHLHPWGEDDGHIMMELIGNDPMITLYIQIGVPGLVFVYWKSWIAFLSWEISCISCLHVSTKNVTEVCLYATI